MNKKEKVVFDADKYSTKGISIDLAEGIDCCIEGYIDEDGLFVITG